MLSMRDLEFGVILVGLVMCGRKRLERLDWRGIHINVLFCNITIGL